MAPETIDFTVPIIMSIFIFCGLNLMLLYLGIISTFKKIYDSKRYNRISISSIIHIVFVSFVVILTFILEARVFYYFTYNNSINTGICMFVVILHMIYLLGDDIYITF
jgi:hypothetical protein